MKARVRVGWHVLYKTLAMQIRGNFPTAICLHKHFEEGVLENTLRR